MLTSTLRGDGGVGSRYGLEEILEAITLGLAKGPSRALSLHCRTVFAVVVLPVSWFRRFAGRNGTSSLRMRSSQRSGESLLPRGGAVTMARFVII